MSLNQNLSNNRNINNTNNSNTGNTTNDLYPDLIINAGGQEEIIKNTNFKATNSLSLADSGALPPLSIEPNSEPSQTYSQTSYNTSNLKYVFTKLLDNSVAIDIMVGFFYFSGFLNLRHELKNKRIRILVGMEIDKSVRNAVEFALSPEKVLEKQDTARAQQEFTKQVQQMFDSAYFEKPENKQAFQIFLEKIQNGTLEVRKTKSPTHAKLYILKPENPNEYNPGAIITGSSNFTLNGLTQNNEVNVLLRQINAVKKAQMFFDDLWEIADPILNQRNVEEFIKKITKTTWYKNLISPRMAYYKAIYEYFKVIPDKLDINVTDYGFEELEWQSHAVYRAIQILQAHGGVLLGDVVGLGKSIIASSIAKFYKNLYRTKNNIDLQIAIITPPRLKSQWEYYKNKFKLGHAKIYSNSIQGLEQAYQDVINTENTKYLFIIDEIHNIRNEDSQTYKLLYDIVFGHYVVGLTATPYNNDPKEIIALLKLFQIPNKPTLGVPKSLNQIASELSHKFEKAKNTKEPTQRKHLLSQIKNQLEQIVEPVLIRRTRMDLLKIPRYKKSLRKKDFSIPDIVGPTLIKLNFGDNPAFIHKTETMINDLLSDEPGKGFYGTIYRPLDYLTDQGRLEFGTQIAELFGVDTANKAKGIQQNNAKMLKNLILKRLESSKYAFFTTVLKLLGKIQILYDGVQESKKTFINKQDGKIDLDSFSIDETTTPQNDSNTLAIDIKYLKPEFIKHVEHDIKILKNTLQIWFDIPEQNIKHFSELALSDSKKDHKQLLQEFLEHNQQDIKLQEIMKILTDWKQKMQSNPTQYGKMVIFTESSDSANYVYEVLKKQGFRVFLATGSNKNKTTREIIEANFNANYEGPLKDSLTEENTYNFLVTTDVLAEGINLHKANAILNLDIPYNPSRVVQRVGRINRIKGMIYNKIYIYNYFPSYITEPHIHIKNITTLKRELANMLFGTDTPVLTDKEWEQIETKNKEKFITIVKTEYEKTLKQTLNEVLEETSWDIKHLNVYFNEILGNKELIKELKELPTRIKIQRSIKNMPNSVDKTEYKDHILVFMKKGDAVLFYINSTDEKGNLQPQSLTTRQAFDLLEATQTEKSKEFSNEALVTFTQLVEKIQKQFSENQQTNLKHSSQNTRQKLIILLQPFPNKLDEVTKQLLKNTPSEQIINQAQYYREYLTKLINTVKSSGALSSEAIKNIYNFIKKYSKAQLNWLEIKELIEQMQQIVSPPVLEKITIKTKQLQQAPEQIIIGEEFK